jgi:hypothetical protein
MTVTQLGGLHKMEGRPVCLALVVGGRTDDCELSCAEGQLIGMTEWAPPRPELEAGGEVPCPRP